MQEVQQWRPQRRRPTSTQCCTSGARCKRRRKISETVIDLLEKLQQRRPQGRRPLPPNSAAALPTRDFLTYRATDQRKSSHLLGEPQERRPQRRRPPRQHPLLRRQCAHRPPRPRRRHPCSSRDRVPLACLGSRQRPRDACDEMLRWLDNSKLDLKQPTTPMTPAAL